MIIRLALLVLFALPSSLAFKTPQQHLVDLAAASNGHITLDEATYDLLTSNERTWAAAIQFTAMNPRRRCVPCKDFFNSFTTVAKAWSNVPEAQRNSHFFATVDFDAAPTLFQKHALSTAPVVLVFSPTEGPGQKSKGRSTPFKYDFTNGFEAGPLAELLSQHTPIQIPYSPPIDWVWWFTTAFGLVSFGMALTFIAPIFKSRWPWALTTVIISLVMTSGYMYTRIRGAPSTGANGQWIAGGYQNQYGREVEVIATLYGALAFSFFVLIRGIPRETSPARQRFQVYFWSAVLILLYSVLLSLFRIKNRGYFFSHTFTLSYIWLTLDYHQTNDQNLRSVFPTNGDQPRIKTRDGTGVGYL